VNTVVVVAVNEVVVVVADEVVMVDVVVTPLQLDASLPTWK
jgi:hypothetical protein